MNMKEYKYIRKAKEVLEVLKEIPVKIKEHPNTTIALTEAAILASLGVKFFNDYYTKTIPTDAEIETILNLLQYNTNNLFGPEGNITTADKMMYGISIKMGNPSIYDGFHRIFDHTLIDEDMTKMALHDGKAYVESIQKIRVPTYAIKGILLEVSAWILGLLGYKVYKEESSKTK